MEAITIPHGVDSGILPSRTWQFDDDQEVHSNDLQADLDELAKSAFDAGFLTMLPLIFILHGWQNQQFSSYLRRSEIQEFLSNLEEWSNKDSDRLQPFDEAWKKEISWRAARAFGELSSFLEPPCSSWKEWRKPKQLCSILPLPLILIVSSILIIVWLWKLEEEAGNILIDGFYVLVAITATTIIFSPFVTFHSAEQLFVIYGAPLPSTAFFLMFPACFPQLRFLYDKIWYHGINAIVVFFMIYTVQYRRRGRNIKLKWRFPILALKVCDDAYRKLLENKSKLEKGYGQYQRITRCFNLDYIGNVKDGLLGEDIPWLLEIMSMKLGEKDGANTQDKTWRNDLSNKNYKKHRAIKKWLTVAFFVVGIVVALGYGLKKDSVSIQLTIYAIVAVGVELCIKTANAGISLKNFIDYLLLPFSLMFLSLVLYIIPTLRFSDVYKGRTTAFWLAYLVSHLSYYGLIGYLLYHVKRMIFHLIDRSERAAADEVVAV